MIDKTSIKAGVAALLLSLLVGFAFAMPVTLHVNLPGRIEIVARYFCPETGKFAPRYFSRRGAREACLDSNGKRIEDRATHNKIIGTIGFLWTLILFAPVYLIFRALFSPAARYSHIVASNSAQAGRVRALSRIGNRRF